MPPKPTYSIKKQLALSLSLVLGVLALISIYFSYQSAQHEIEEIYDARLGQHAKLLLLFSDSLETHPELLQNFQQQYAQWMQELSPGGSNDVNSVMGHPYEKNMLFQLYHQGQLLWSSLPEVGALHTLPAIGFSDVDVDDEVWRVFTFQSSNDQDSLVVVAEKQSIRQEMVEEIALATNIPYILFIPVFILIILTLVYKYFEPLHALKNAIIQRNAYQLDKIHIPKNTVELSPLIEALNSLLAQLDETRKREQSFMRMAAHELKTPLTILRLNAENALASEDRETLENELRSILKSIERTDRIMVQLLHLTKVEGLQSISKSTFDVVALLRSLLSELMPLTIKNHQTIALEGLESFFYRGDKTLLAVLFRNLLDNAHRYSGEDADITVRVSHQSSTLIIQVQDSGTRIPNDIRTRLFEPFFRGTHTASTRNGAGLGMSITLFIAKLHGGNIRLEDSPEDRLGNTFSVTLALTMQAVEE